MSLTSQLLSIAVRRCAETVPANDRVEDPEPCLAKCRWDAHRWDVIRATFSPEAEDRPKMESRNDDDDERLEQRHEPVCMDARVGYRWDAGRGDWVFVATSDTAAGHARICATCHCRRHHAGCNGCSTRQRQHRQHRRARAERLDQ